MNKISIAIDVDDVLADTLVTILAYDNKKYNLNYEWKEFNTYKFWNIWNCSKEESLSRVNDFFESNEGNNISPTIGSKEAIEKLSKKYILHIITGRPKQYDNVTKEFLNKNYNTKFASIAYTAHYTKEKPIKKFEICKEINAKIIIEDDLEHAIDCANNGIITILMDKPWNQDIYHENIIRTYSWNEAVENIENISKNMN